MATVRELAQAHLISHPSLSTDKKRSRLTRAPRSPASASRRPWRRRASSTPRAASAGPTISRHGFRLHTGPERNQRWPKFAGQGGWGGSCVDGAACSHLRTAPAQLVGGQHLCRGPGARSVASARSPPHARRARALRVRRGLGLAEGGKQKDIIARWAIFDAKSIDLGDFGQVWTDSICLDEFGQFWREFEQVLVECGQRWGEHRPMLDDVSQFWGQFWWTLANSGLKSTNARRIWPVLVRHRPTLGEFGQCCGDIDHCLAALANFGRSWPGLGLLRHFLGVSGRFWSDAGSNFHLARRGWSAHSAPWLAPDAKAWRASPGPVLRRAMSRLWPEVSTRSP